MNKIDNNSQYVEGNSRVRLAIFSFFGFFFLIGLFLGQIAQKKIEQLFDQLNANNMAAALGEIDSVFIIYIIVPTVIFCIIQGFYFMWLGIKTLATGIYPPPDVSMPTRTKIERGKKAKLSGISFIVAGFCNVLVIASLFLTRYYFFKILQ